MKATSDRETGKVVAFPGQTAGEVEETAARWLARLTSGEASAAELVEFELWRAQAPDHDRIFRELDEIWKAAGGAGDVLVSPAAQRRSGRLLGWARGGAVAAGFIASTGLLWQWSTVWRFDQVTGAGQVRTVALADGSKATLNTDTALDIHIAATGERRITLDRGEAFFEVQRDPSRPFIVDAGVGQVKVLGTGFSVRREAREITVTVEHGRVEVSGPAGAAILNPGEQVTLGVFQVGRDLHVDAGRTLAWRRGLIFAENEPLGNVLADIDRYYPGRIVVSDPVLRARRINAVVRIDRLDEWLDALDKSEGVDVRKWGPLLVISKGE